MTQKRTHIAPARKKKLPKYESFKLTRNIKPDKIKVLPTSKALWKETWLFIWKNKKIFVKFLAVYAICYLILVKGINNFHLDVSSLTTKLKEIGAGNIGSIFGALAIYATLVSSLTGTTSDISNFFQVSVLIIFSLAFIWLIRKMHSKRLAAPVKDSFYKGMRPLIPFLGVLVILILELLPAGIGALLLVTVQGASVVSTEAEITGVAILMILTLVLSVYLLAGSVFALYIVTLPEATPLLAIRSSMRLLRIHRWVVLRKIVAFFFMLFVLGFATVLPFILWLPQYAEVAFFIMGCSSFGVMHTYMYKLYRSMIS